MNKVCLTGRITKEPEIKYTPNNVAYMMFILAVDRGYKDKDGQKITDFLPCVAWQSQAEFISKYVKKGNLLEATGQMQSRSYQNQQGETKVVIEMVLDSVSNLTPKPKEEAPAPQEPSYGGTKSEAPEQFTVSDDDLPF